MVVWHRYCNEQCVCTDVRMFIFLRQSIELFTENYLFHRRQGDRRHYGTFTLPITPRGHYVLRRGTKLSS